MPHFSRIDLVELTNKIKTVSKNATKIHIGQYEIMECNIMSQDAIYNIFRNIKPNHKNGTNIWEQMLQIKKTTVA